ncbi:MAG: hypothetical protein KKH28_01940, partial [Elusimicrobia bacterium]|nr:hypothetical protein [Elusimicrobiota bacterium]
MKRTLLLRNVFILCMPSILFNASIGYSAAENKVVLDSSATIKSAEQGRKAGRLREKLNKINDAAL